jgi:methylated-DNA-[protein]-cysteine S-methyltransferase
MNPSNYPLFWHPSPVGAVGFSFKDASLWEISLKPWEPCPPNTVPPSHESRAFSRALDEYFAGQLAAIDAFKTVPQRGTPFQRDVWQALARISPHQHQTYAAVAAAVGRPKAVRATGSAIGKNPLFIVLPCHRVLGKDGSLRGFACGLDVKRWLLEHEAKHLAKTPT